MSDSIYVSRRSITFAANTARYASKYGLKKGAQKAASKANPAIMVIEAGISVAKAVQSFYKVKEAKAERDGLKEYIPKVEKRLRAEREALEEQAKMLREELNLKRDKQAEIQKFVLSIAQFYRDASDELEKLKASNVTDINELDRQEKNLVKHWKKFQRALQTYTEIIH